MNASKDAAVVATVVAEGLLLALPLLLVVVWLLVPSRVPLVPRLPLLPGALGKTLPRGLALTWRRKSNFLRLRRWVGRRAVLLLTVAVAIPLYPDDFG